MTLPISAALTANLIYDKEHHASLSAPDDAWENNRMFHVFTYVAETWSSDAAWDEQDDGLIFNPQSSLIGSARSTHDLAINADGKLSHALWLFCIVVALFAARSQWRASFGDLIEENGPEGTASLTRFKARLINVQRYIERIHDGDSVDGDVEGGGNLGSTSPPFPHPVLELDYDTESDHVAQPVQVQARPTIAPRGTSTSITAGLDSGNPRVVVGQTLGAGPRDPEISKRFSPIPHASHALSQSPFISCPPTLPATEQSYQETPSFSMDRTTGQRDRSPSAEGERPPKRVRSGSDSVVVDRLGRTTPECTRRQGQHRDASDEDDIQTTDDDATHQMALLLARTVVGLCRDRYRPPTVRQGQRGVGMTAAELGDVLDVRVFPPSLIRLSVVA